MRLRPTPAPKPPVLTVYGLTDGIEGLLAETGTYSDRHNRRAAAENLTYAVARVWRGSVSSSTVHCIDDVNAATARRRLRRAASLFVELADRLED